MTPLTWMNVSPYKSAATFKPVYIESGKRISGKAEHWVTLSFSVQKEAKFPQRGLSGSSQRLQTILRQRLNCVQWYYTAKNTLKGLIVTNAFLLRVCMHNGCKLWQRHWLKFWRHSLTHGCVLYPTKSEKTSFTGKLVTIFDFNVKAARTAQPTWIKLRAWDYDENQCHSFNEEHLTAGMQLHL